MKYHTLEQLERLAMVSGEPTAQSLTKTLRLERWADLLEAKAQAQLATLRGTEFSPDAFRAAMRADNSPISVAFADPDLRAAGLRDDTYGEAKRFFEMTDWDLHRALCHCHFGSTVEARRVARSIRSTLNRVEAKGWVGRLRSALSW